MVNRRFKDIGFKPVFVFPVLLIIFFGLSLYLFSKTEYAVYVYLFSALALIGRRSETRRTEFLKICFGNRRLEIIRIAENLICALPFVVFLLYKQYYLFTVLLLILVTIVALANYRTSLNLTLWTPFSKRSFEFSIGFRNTFYLFFAAYTLAFIAVSVHNFNLGILAMLLVFVTTWSYYFKPESEYYVWTYNQKPRQFLLGKIKTALLFSFLLALPIASILAIFFFHNIVLIGLFFLGGWGFLTAIVICKYSAYPAEMTIITAILLTICLWFPPMLLVLIPYFFRKSTNKLSHLLK